MIRAGKGAIYVAVQNISVFAIGLIYYSIIARFLTEAEIGLIGTLNFIIQIYSIFAVLALPIAATKYISEYLKNSEEKASAVAKKTTRLVLFSSTLLFVGILLIVLFLEYEYSIKILIIITCATAFLTAIRSAFLAFLQGLQMFGKYSISILLSVITNRLVGIIFILNNYGLLGAVSGWLIGEAIGLLITWSFYHGILPKTNELFSSQRLLTFSIPLFFTALINTISVWADRILFLALTKNFETLGVYELAIKGSNTLALIWITFSIVMLPTLSELFGKKNKRGLSEAITETSRYLAYIFFPASFGLATISKTAMSLLYGRLDTLGNSLLSILSIFSIFAAFGAIIGSALHSIGETKVFIGISLVTMVTDILVSIALIPTLGIIGSTMAKSATMVVGFTFGLYILTQSVKVKFDSEALWKSALASFIMALSLLFLENSGILFVNPFVNIIIEIAVGVVIYCLILFLLKAFNEKDFDIFRQIMPKPFTIFVELLEKIFLQKKQSCNDEMR